MAVGDYLSAAAKYAGWKSESPASNRPNLEAANSSPQKVEAQKRALERNKNLWKNPAEAQKLDSDLEQLLPAEVARITVVNVGEPEITGFKRRTLKKAGAEGTLEQPYKESAKDRCEDRKVNDPDHGLFAVMDGVSTARGDWKGVGAAEITSRFVQSEMGERLDRELENIAKAKKSTEAHVNEAVVAAMRRTVVQSQDAIEHAQDKKVNANFGRYLETNTTLALAKMVDMPDGNIRLYYTSLGDSRIHLENEDGTLTPLTEDDSELRADIQEGSVKITPEEEDAIDQYAMYDALTNEQKMLADKRAIITAAVGTRGVKTRNLRFDANDPQNSDIFFVDLQPGQKVVITSDGVHDNLLRSKMAEALKKDDPRAIERKLQEDALAVQHNPSNSRSKPDDIAAVVFEAKHRGEQLKARAERPVAEGEQSKSSREYTPAQAAAWPDELESVGAELAEVNQEILDLQAQGDSTEAAKAERDRNLLEKQKVHLEYWIAKAKTDEIEDRLPGRSEIPPKQARAEKGDRLSIMLERPKAGEPAKATEVLVTGVDRAKSEVTLSYMKDGKVAVKNFPDLPRTQLHETLVADLTAAAKARETMAKKLKQVEQLNAQSKELKSAHEQVSTKQKLDTLRTKLDLPHASSDL